MKKFTCIGRPFSRNTEDKIYCFMPLYIYMDMNIGDRMLGLLGMERKR